MRSLPELYIDAYDLFDSHLSELIQKLPTDKKEFRILDIGTGCHPRYLFHLSKIAKEKNLSITFVCIDKAHIELMDDLVSLKEKCGESESSLTVLNEDININISKKNNITGRVKGLAPFDIVLINATVHELHVNYAIDDYFPEFFKSLSEIITKSGWLFIGDYYFPPYLAYSKRKTMVDLQLEITNHADPPEAFIDPNLLSKYLIPYFDILSLSQISIKPYSEYPDLLKFYYAISLKKKSTTNPIEKTFQNEIDLILENIGDCEIHGEINKLKEKIIINETSTASQEIDTERIYEEFFEGDFFSKVARLVNKFIFEWNKYHGYNINCRNSIWISYNSRFPKRKEKRIDPSVLKDDIPLRYPYCFIGESENKNFDDDLSFLAFNNFLNRDKIINNLTNLVQPSTIDIPNVVPSLYQWMITNGGDDFFSINLICPYKQKDASENRFINYIINNRREKHHYIEFNSDQTSSWERPLNENLNYWQDESNLYKSFLWSIFCSEIVDSNSIDYYQNVWCKVTKPNYSYKFFSTLNLKLPNDTALGTIMIFSDTVYDSKLLDCLIVLLNRYFLKLSHIDNILNEKEDLNQTKIHARKAANISILVDSFAHNVAAHSLNALSNYFAIRKNELEKRVIKKDIEYHGYAAKALLQSEILCLSKTAESEYNKLIGLDYTDGEKEKISISDIIKFGNEKLLERLFHLKQPGYGKENIYLPVPIDDSVCSFINYMAEKSEFWSSIIAGESFNNSISSIFDLIWGFVDNPLFIGTLAGSERIHKIKFVIDNKPFALVDFSVINAKELSGNYQFIKPLENFEEVKTDLSAKEVLLPGSNVGKQSVYTIFENCLRNIKHYDLSDQGIDEVEFHLNIVEDPGGKQSSFEMYLGLTKYLNDKPVADVIKEVETQINKGTFDIENSQPILGGTSQSILCANHLITGRFADEGNISKNFEVKNQDNFIKYTFRMWKGEKVKSLVEIDTLTGADNISRYKFLTMPADSGIEQLRKSARDAIRILKTKTTKVDEVYKEWLKYWLGNTNYECELKDKDPIELKCGDKFLIFGHEEASDNSKLGYRNHGIFKRDIENKWNELKYDVTEAMLTGVYIIDNRLYNVFKEKEKTNKNKIEDELHLFVKEEDRGSLKYNNIISIDGENAIICDKINFLIIHLSFIESLNAEYKNDINKFIAKIIEAINGRENFHLIITTGRGRTNWKDSISDEYKNFVKHRSVLSLQNALLDGVMKGDDFNLKYNIIKVLFGS